ncbi:MAG: NAD(P)H-dependent glycerol-3-phosphate dehydrogenase [Kiritimatiellia bacterium]|nr:NAD(P)H-dependent glycerol-3-phosphate dehydrogenase [Kiritimatiellia bacterium]
MKHVTIIGDGGWGTALALHFTSKNLPVKVWGPDAEYLASVRKSRENKLYLPGIPLPDSIHWTADCQEAAAAADLAVLAVPSKYCRAVFQKFAGLLEKKCAVLSVCKGLDPSTRKRISEVAAEYFCNQPIAVLSGPSHAEEVARGIPTAVVLASQEQDLADRIQKMVMTPKFRIYTTDDVAGVELGGALKNVIAIAVGISDGIGFGDNTSAALITRGLAEITRIGGGLGGRFETFTGLSGLGDLIVTCTSHWSRNRSVGERLGKGEAIGSITTSMKQVAEGVTTCAGAHDIAKKIKVAAPIIDEVYAVIQQGKSPAAAVAALLSRVARPERDIRNAEGRMKNEENQKKSAADG